LIFKPKVENLLDRLKSATNTPIGDLDFGRGLERAEGSIEDAQQAEQAAGHQPPAGTRAPTRNAGPTDLARSAGKDPTYTIVTAWEQLLNALRSEWVARGLDGDFRGIPEFAQVHVVLRDLQSAEALPSEATAALQELRSLRNQVAHGQARPSSGEAAAYVAAAENVLRILRTQG